MQQIVILGGGAAGLAAALAAAQSAPAGAVRVTMLDRNPRCGKKLLATGNGRCNLDNTGIAPEQYFTADPAALRPLLAAVDAAAPLEWFAALGLYTRTDEAGRVYPYSNQAADVLALLEGHLARLGVEVRTGCTVQTLSQNRSGYTILCEDAEGQDQTLRADAVICAMGGNAGPQFGTDGTLIFADCGLNINPSSDELSEIAIASAHSWSTFMGNVEPHVAMLSYSTMGSAGGEVAKKVQEAVKFCKEKAPELAIDGDLQLDAAIVPTVAQLKAPGSSVAGKANVLVFPDLEAGNIGYKLVQRFAGADAYGPILQGIAKPVNDLSRGCSADDIVGVVAITAVQAQMAE